MLDIMACLCHSMLMIETTPEAISKAKRMDKRVWEAALKDAYAKLEGLDNNLQNVHTPFDLCHEMLVRLETFTSLRDKKILCLNHEFIEVLIRDFGIIKENIWFATDCEPKARILQHERYKGVNCLPDDFLKWETDMKFDLVIGNPPYKGNLHLDFLLKAKSITKEGGVIEWIAPGTWLLSEKTNSHKAYERAKKEIGNDLYRVKLVNGNKAFGIASFVPLANSTIKIGGNFKKIIVVDINGKEYVAKSFDFIPPRMSCEEYRTLKEKVLNACEDGDVESHRIINENKGGNVNHFFVDMSQIRGNVNQSNDNSMIKDDFFTILPRGSTVTQSPEKWMYFEFETKEEAENCLYYFKTFFARFCLSIFKTNSDLHRGAFMSVPWMDFTKKWTDEKLFKHFNLSEKEIAYIKNTIPPYYDDVVFPE